MISLSQGGAVAIEFARRTASHEVAAAILSAFYHIDVTKEAGALDLPVR